MHAPGGRAYCADTIAGVAAQGPGNVCLAGRAVAKIRLQKSSLTMVPFMASSYAPTVKARTTPFRLSHLNHLKENAAKAGGYFLWRPCAGCNNQCTLTLDQPRGR